MISNCGSDENGKYSGGIVGDQTGNEWAVIKWYNRPWNYVLRYPDPMVRKQIADLARAAAKNDKIGYDQSNRYSFWNQLKANGYNPAKITVACESDCSAGVAAIVKAVGYLLDIKELQAVSIYCYTGNLRPALKAVGFEVLTASKYLVSDKYLVEGDVLLYEGHHTAINLDNGSEVKLSHDCTLDIEVSLPSLVRGHECEYVKTLQRLLASRGYNTNGIDGIFGAGTAQAVQKFQSDQDIKVNYPGTVGRKTWEALLKG